jgi:monoamine oxidase
VAVASIVQAQTRIDRLAQQVPLEEPWAAPRAAEWDSRTVADWLRRSGVKRGVGRDLFDTAISGLMTGDLDDVSFLHLLWLVKAHRSLNVLFSIENGAQENLVDGGAGSIAMRVAEELGDAIRLSSPVRAIEQHGDHVVVTAATATVAARHVVVAIPPALILEIEFTPALPDDRRTLYRNDVGGPETKTLLVFDEPFWRADGLSGQSSEPGSPAEVTIDASPVDASRGVLASFTFGRVAEQWDGLDPADRRAALLDALASRFGPRVRAPREIGETAWWQQEWTRGCSFAHLRPGILSRFGPLLREPMGRVHWAGTETATLSHGAMDGAVRSGERVTAEILDRS